MRLAQNPTEHDVARALRPIDAAAINERGYVTPDEGSVLLDNADLILWFCMAVDHDAYKQADGKNPIDELKGSAFRLVELGRDIRAGRRKTDTAVFLGAHEAATGLTRALVAPHVQPAPEPQLEGREPGARFPRRILSKLASLLHSAVG